MTIVLRFIVGSVWEALYTTRPARKDKMFKYKRVLADKGDKVNMNLTVIISILYGR